MIIDDGVVSTLNVESGPSLEVSSAETILEAL
jgi:peroxiredoxin